MIRPRWDVSFRHLMSFLFTPERWARTDGVELISEVEELRKRVLHWLYFRVGAPRIGLNGERDVLSMAPAISPTAPYAIKALTDQSEDVNNAYLRYLEGLGLKIMFTPEGPTFDDALHWDHIADHVNSPALKRALGPIQRELELSKTRRWIFCPLCARAFPKQGKTKACPPCRRKWSRRQVQWRLAHAPRDPVVFHVMPAEDPESVRLAIAEGVKAPPALRRISISP